MILFLRKYFHKGLMQGLVLVTALSLVGIGSFSSIISLFFSDSRNVFTVNGHGVTKQLFGLRAATEKKIIDFYKEQLGDLAPRFLAQVGMAMSPEKNAYNKMVQELALVSCVERSGLRINTRAIAQKAQDPMAVMNIFGASLPRALYDRNGKLQQDILIRLLSSIGLTLQDFEKMLEETVQRELALDLIRLAVPVTEKEITVQALKEYGVRTFTITSYSISGYLKEASKTDVSPETLKTFFNEQNVRSHRYWTSEKRSGNIWKIPTTEKNKEKVTQAAQEALNGADADFNAFITQYKGVKSAIKDQPLRQDVQQSVMLFKLDLNTKGLYHEDNQLVIVMPTQIVAAVEKPYEAVEKEVKQDYYLGLAQKALVEDLEGAGVGDAHKTGTQTVVLKPENMQAELDKLNKKSISADRMKNMVVEGTHLKGLRDDGGYLITLVSVEKPQSLTPEQYLAARSAVFKENERIVTAASVDSLLKNAKIKTNKELES